MRTGRQRFSITFGARGFPAQTNDFLRDVEESGRIHLAASELNNRRLDRDAALTAMELMRGGTITES